jgi:hypothetical protein
MPGTGKFIYIYICSCIRPPGIYLGMSWRFEILISVKITDALLILFPDIRILAKLENKFIFNLKYFDYHRLRITCVSNSDIESFHAIDAKKNTERKTR